ncbi:Polyadenylate-binding protein 2 [Cardamine amara subsp. amara]|uniref:Polyadenylate-binding protein 2 n=1 Tax=Cardamine amara subsp. amara TaxID=228776 RepID=A0ABD1BX30_CARAN
MPIYPPGGPGIGQQMFYGQAPHAIIPSQAGYGYQQQLVPGMRPGGALMHNFFMPMVQKGQQRPGGIQQSQHQMHPRGRNECSDTRKAVVVVVLLMDLECFHTRCLLTCHCVSQCFVSMFLLDLWLQPLLMHQRTMLGENLYPLVEQLEAESAAKVTRMLLEMDQTQVLHLLESPDALKAKVAEAMEVLRSVAAGGTAEQLASLNLNDNLFS